MRNSLTLPTLAPGNRRLSQCDSATSRKTSSSCLQLLRNSQASCMPAGSASPRLYVGRMHLKASTETHLQKERNIFEKIKSYKRPQFGWSVSPCLKHSRHKMKRLTKVHRRLWTLWTRWTWAKVLGGPKRPVLPMTVATSHTQLLSTWNVASASGDML